MKYSLLLAILSICIFSAYSQNMPLGAFEKQQDIGHVKYAGSAVYDEVSQSYSIKGSGSNIWFNNDQFHYTFKKIAGDFILTADFAFAGDTTGANEHRKMGWMIRESEEADAVNMSACLHLNGLIALQWREMRGAYMQDPQGEIFFPKGAYKLFSLKEKERH